MGAPESAENLLTDALSSTPDHAWAHCLMAAVLISTRRAERRHNGMRASAQPPIQVWQARTAMLGLAKYLLGQSEETESHVEEALRLSPLDTFAYLWMLFAGVAKIQTEEYDKAVEWLRRSIETNPKLSLGLFSPGGRTAVVWQGGGSASGNREAGLLLDPTFTTERYRSLAFSDHRRYVTIRERTIQALQATGVPSESEGQVTEGFTRVCMYRRRCFRDARRC